MTDYTKTTDFEAKDSLPSGDTNKVVRGSEFEVEFDNIATAIATKANKASPTFTGTATIPTASITTLNLGGVAVTSTATELNLLDGVTATTAELNILDGVTATATELNLLDGVTATTAELNYVDGVTSNIQTQLNTKAPTASPTFTGTATIPTASVTTLNLGGVAVTSTAAELNKLDGVTATTAEINYLDGVTSNIQTQLDGLGTGDGSVTSVAMTVPTGLSVAGTPITTSGTLAVTYATGYAIPTTAKQTQWDTAYGWGNHASAGYAPTASPTFTGTVTAPTVDINAGAIDGTTIGAASAAAGTFTTATATSVVLGLWTISVIANELVFDYNGTDVFKLKTTGEVVSANDVTAFGTV